jgi:hypothetical protein
VIDLAGPDEVVARRVASLRAEGPQALDLGGAQDREGLIAARLDDGFGMSPPDGREDIRRRGSIRDQHATMRLELRIRRRRPSNSRRDGDSVRRKSRGYTAAALTELAAGRPASRRSPSRPSTTSPARKDRDPHDGNGMSATAT